NAQKPQASKQSRCHLGWVTLTRICTSSASMPFGQRCGFSWHRRTSPAFCSCRPLSNKRVWLPSTPTVRSRRPNAGEARPRPSRGRSDGRRPGPAMASTGYFPPALRAFASRSKIAGLRHPPLVLRPSALLRVLARAARRLSDRHEGAEGRGRSGKGPHPMTDYDDIEPPHASSPTDHVLSELQLFGYRPFSDEPDPRPLPEGKMIAGALADIFDALVATLNDTRLEPDLEGLLWST